MDWNDSAGLIDIGVFSVCVPIGVLVGAAIVHLAEQHYRRVFLRYGNLMSRCGLPGCLVARRLLSLASHPNVEVISGPKQNHYHPWRQRIHLTADTYSAPSLHSLAAAAHEVGHAQQFQTNVPLCRLRRILWPLCWTLPAVVVALLVSWTALGVPSIETTAAAIVAACTLSVLLQFPITLPLERDASLRATELVRQAGLLAAAEKDGFERLLNAARMTHAAAEARRWILLIVLAAVSCLVPGYVNGWTNPEAAPGVAIGPAHRPSPEYQPRQFPTQGVAPAGIHPVEADGPTHALWDIMALAAPFSVLFLLVWTTKLFKKTKLTNYELAVRHNNQARAAKQRGETPRAIELFSKAISLDPTLMASYLNRGICHLDTGDIDKALEDFAMSVELAPNFAESLLHRGSTLLAKEHFAEAQRDFDRAIELVPENPVAFTCRGHLKHAKEDFSGAIEDYTAAILIDSEYHEPYRDRALTWYSQGHYDKAIRDLDVALRLKPDDWLALNNRGAAHLQLGNYLEADCDLMESVRLAPDFANPYKHLAWLQATCPESGFRDGQQAVENATTALELVEWQQSEWTEVLAAAHAEANNFSEAVRWEEQRLEHSSEHQAPEIRNRLELYRANRPYRSR